MKLPTAELKSDLIALGLEWIQPDNIVENNMNSDQKNDVDDTILFLTEVTNQPSNYADDIFKKWSICIELQIFWGVNTDFNIQQAEIDLHQKLIKKGWSVEQSSSHTVDPDTGQVTKTMYVSNNNKF